MLNDLRLAIRMLRRTPIVTAVAVLSLALGVGANTALFSLIDGLVLRSLPVPAPERLAVVSGGIPTFPFVAQLPGYTWRISTALADHAALFDRVGAWSPARVDLATGGEARIADGLVVSGDFFATVGVSPALGRTLTTADDVPGAPRVAVISYQFWQQLFGGGSDAIGKPLSVERALFTVVGVAPPEFRGPEVGRGFDVAVPIASAAAMGRANMLDAWVFRLFIRLKPGQSIEQATAALRAVQPRIREAAAPADASANLDILKTPLTLVSASAGTSALRSRYARPLFVLFAIVAFVLLVACANLANLQLARAFARRAEFSLRLALGASRASLVRQVLIESLLLSLAGAAAGLVCAQWSARALVAQLSSAVNRVVLDVPLDWRTFGFTTTLAVLTALVFGTIPALLATRTAPIEAMKEHATGMAGGGSPRRLSGGLVMAQVALSLVLLTATGLFLRSFTRLTSTPTGFDADRVLVVNVNTTHSHVEPAKRWPLFSQMMRDIAQMPGVAAVGGSTLTPAGGVSVVNFVARMGDAAIIDSAHAAATNTITPGWLSVYGFHLTAGRDFNAHDTPQTPRVVVVNEAFVEKFEKFLNGRRAIDSTIVTQDGTPMTVVGVVSDAIYNSLREPMPAAMFVPLTQAAAAPAALNINIRVASGPPANAAPAIARLLQSTDPELTFTFRELGEQLDASIAQDRIMAMLSACFGILAVALAGVGVYGITAYAVTRRRREFAIRRAIGATPASIVRLMLTGVLRLLAGGLLIGALTSRWASGFVQALLFGIDARDPVTLLDAVVVLTTIALLAGVAASYRATRIASADVLRES